MWSNIIHIIGGPGPIQFQLAGKRPINPTNPLMGVRPITPTRFAPHQPMMLKTPELPKAHNQEPKKSPVEIPSTENWRPSLKAYVARAFASVSDGREKDDMEAFLKEKLTQAYENKTEHLYNWDIEPLPGQRGKNKARGGKNKGRGRGRGTVRPSRWDNASVGSPDNNKTDSNGRLSMSNWRERDSSRHSPISRYRNRSYSWSRSRSRSYGRYSSSSSSRFSSRSRSPPTKSRRRSSRYSRNRYVRCIVVTFYFF